MFVNRKGRSTANAIEYRNPANTSGGISFNPSFIITNDVDQRKVTRRASSIALNRAESFIFIDTKISIEIILEKVLCELCGCSFAEKAKTIFSTYP